jgi:hypothetical protein
MPHFRADLPDTQAIVLTGLKWSPEIYQKLRSGSTREVCMSLPTVAVVAYNHFLPFMFSAPCII